MIRKSAPAFSDPMHARRIVGISQRREPLRFLICDAFMNVLFAAPDIDADLTSRQMLAALAPHCHESRTHKATVFHVHDNDSVLRIVPLNASLAGCVAIFIESFARRGSIFEAAKTFGLTKRESEVLPLLVRGKTNAEIADALCVAESTVGDYVKSILRKAGTSKRVELISRIFNVDHDLAQLASG